MMSRRSKDDPSPRGLAAVALNEAFPGVTVADYIAGTAVRAETEA
jgi:hypothetical protein